MKRIIFEKLTVRETAHIHGASLNVSYIQSTLFNEEACGGGTTPDGGEECQLTMESVIDCENPSVPHVECANTPQPTKGCAAIWV